MKHLYKLCLALILPLLMLGCKTRKLAASKPAASVIFKAPANFRVVGYIVGNEIAKGDVANFDMSRLNYLNIFFNGPGANGKFKEIPHLDSTIDAAHKNHVTVLATIGNGVSLSLITDSSRANFIDSLVSSVVSLKLDGIDVDLEGDHINKDYEAFVGALSAALKAKGKLMTAAIATWESATLTDKAFSYFDFLNVMTYDATGPWNLKEPGPHSPYSMAVADLDFWTNKRHIAKERLNLGLPFYGYGFEPTLATEFKYRKIVDMYPGSELVDSVAVTPTNIIYYNGIATIKKKTAFAMQNCGGVMIWELMEDADGDRSLLKAINSAIKDGK
jgi:chitinase